MEKIKCHLCNKKKNVIYMYVCKCNFTFCERHRYPETHQCTFKYLLQHQKDLEEKEKIIPKKIDYI